MEYEKRIICFFDILGFGSIVANKFIDAPVIEQLFNEIQVIISVHKKDDIQISHFSDSFVISIRHTRASPTQLQFVVAVLVKLLEYKLIARGAIVHDEIIHTERNIYGPGLVRAAELEKNKAIFPRIILDKNLSDLSLPTVGNAKISYTEYFNGFAYVTRDSLDNEYYIDFITSLYKQANSGVLIANMEYLISIGLKSEKEKVVEKYVWLQNKFNVLR